MRVAIYVTASNYIKTLRKDLGSSPQLEFSWKIFFTQTGYLEINIFKKLSYKFLIEVLPLAAEFLNL
jgi:hypothetical protein